ncbi:ABC transporter permease [Svornostia abyssi]|uniref:ABC transporter permease n=1 Tax=Svornostia abyssi TaxID=2898438 RepID=A0ABY5PIP2_9ACTN|nr:ABC transporter permease [Parviterribacteraceae bacterium J379]
MGRFIIRRLVGMVIVLFAVSVIVFAIFNVIPNGAPENRMAGKQSTPQQIEAIRREWGFDKPITTQYVKMMEKLATGDLVSYQQQRNVFDEIKQGLPHTLSLAIGAAILWMAAGVALGVYSATRAGGKTDFAINVLALIGISVPVFWLGALVNYYLGYKLGWFPNGGYVEVAEGGLWQWAYHLFMPWTVLALLFIGVYSRVLRGTILETQNEDFVRTARAKGLSEKQVMRRHVLRTSMIPIITLWGLDFGIVIGGGAILTEAVFDLQGVGQYYAESVSQLDVPPVMAITILGAVFIVVLNTIVDILYAALDPRIRLS